MKKKSIFIFLFVAFFWGCQHTRNDTPIPQLRTEAELDSIFALFEMIADEDTLYLQNPDSLLHSLPALPETPLQQEMFANGLLLMAYALAQHGNNYESIKYYEKALNFTENHQLHEIDKNTYIIRPLANLYISIDDNNKAIALLENSIPEIEDIELKNSFLIALANAYLFHGRPHESKRILLKVGHTSSNSLSKARAYNILSDIYKEEEDTTICLQYNTLAIREFEKNDLQGEAINWYASALALKGAFENDNLKINQALNLIHQHHPSSQQRTKAKLIVMDGDLDQKNRRWLSASTKFHQVILLLRQDQQPYTLDYTYTRALYGIAQSYQHESNIDSALHYYQWAIENDFRTQQLITGKADQLKNNTWHRQMVEQMIDLIAQQLTLPYADEHKLKRQLLWCIELSKARLLINEINRSELWESASIETKQAIQQIRSLYTRQDQTRDPENKQHLQKQIDKLLIDFQLSEKYFETLDFNPDQNDFFSHIHRLDTDYYSYFIHQDKQVSIVSKVDAHYHYDRITDTAFMSEIDRFKRTYLGDSPDVYRNNPKQYHMRSQEIAKKLLPHIGKKGGDIYASLDGNLYGLPLDALWDQDFLLSKYNFAYLHSFLLFDLLPSDKSTDNQINLLYRAVYPDPLPDLNFVPQEVTSISRSFKTRQVPPEQQRDAVIRDIFATPHIVHIAAHTLVDKENQAPLIYLEQMISTNQIRFYQMNAPLVFLSACHTGSGLALPSEGMESIQRAFLGKGVPSVISTYWFANDQVMLQLTADFYQQLARSHQPIHALALAKRNYLARADNEQQNPWYWANINYTGVGNEIGLKKSSNLSSFTYGILCLSLFGLTYLWWRRSRFNRPFIKIDQKTDH